MNETKKERNKENITVTNRNKERKKEKRYNKRMIHQKK